MQAWYHCENVYPFVPQEVLDRAESVRASLPNRYCDPRIAADLFEECLDEHLLCDELGINIVSIEHHSGINSLYGASTMVLGIMARQTRNVRILSLGTLVSVRPDPVRIAEEYATADVIRATAKWCPATPTRSVSSTGSGRRWMSSSWR
jgi:hypothetical protein